MKKALMIVAMVAIVAIAGSMIYYFVFYKAEKERAEVALQEQKLEDEKEKQNIEEQKKDQEEIKAATDERIEQKRKKDEVLKYINDYDNLLSQIPTLEDEKELDATMDVVSALLIKINSLYVPETCDTLHDLQLQYWQTYYLSRVAYKSNDIKKAEDLIGKCLELSNQVIEEARKLLR